MATDCNGKRVSGVVVDGNKDPNNDVEIESQCEGRHSILEIYFVKSLKVHYVVVYAGKSKDKITITFMFHHRNFILKLSRNITLMC